MTIDVGAVADALRDAGVLVKTARKLPAQATGITDDSRGVTRGSIFVAVRGTAADGHEFLAAAAEAGAAVAIVEDPKLTRLPSLIVNDSRAAAAVAAAVAYGHPARGLRLVGVTGTNGKTTVTGLLRAILHEDSAPGASIGTLGVLVGVDGDSTPGGAGLTTPGPVELQRVLRALADAGVRSVAMEVSSHSLDQGRIAGLHFDVAVFTNLSRDHLDYHRTMEAYFAAKTKLLSYLVPDGVAVINAEESAWASLPPAPRKFLFGRWGDLKVANASHSVAGAAFDLIYEGATYRAELPLIGDFNVENAAAAAGAALQLGIPMRVILSRLANAPQVPGRLEILAREPTIIRDYAHTPDALDRLLKALRPMCAGRLIVVFGCGGDRDKGKRPLMGAIVSRRADIAIVTSDNPRTEDPEKIIDEIVAAMTEEVEYERIEDRRAAIERAIALADPLDVVVIAGKGHETYQVRGTTHFPFDEKEIVSEILAPSR